MFASSWRYKWYIIGVALLAAAVSYGVSLLQDPLYRAEGTILLNDPRSSDGVGAEIDLILDPARYVPNQVKIIESPQVAQRAAEDLATGITTSEVQAATTATPAPDLGAITIAGTMPTSSESVALVDAVVKAYEEISTEEIQRAADARIATLEVSRIETEVRIAELDAQIAENPDDSALEARRTAAIDQFVALDTRIKVLATNAALYGSGVQLYVAPDAPTVPIQPRPRRNAAIALLIGAFVAGAWAWWRTDQHQVADNRDVAANVLDAPLLATIPEYRSAKAVGPAPTILSPTSTATEAYHFALSSLGFALERIKGHTVLVTSSSAGAGKTTTALNLAIVAAKDGRNPLLIDADERVRGLTTLAGLDGEPGVTDLIGPGSVQPSTHRWTLVDGTLVDVIPAGTGVAGKDASFFRTEGFEMAMSSVVEGRDIVFIDTPPVMAAAETADIAAFADVIVVVVTEGTPLKDLDDARRRLQMSGTPIVGYIFNRATAKSDIAGYGYGHRYGTTSQP